MALCKRLTGARDQERFAGDQENRWSRGLSFFGFLFPFVSAFQDRLRLAVDRFFV